MGHLINPTALRLGWKLNWIDNIYSDRLYYPENIHTVLRLRYLLSSLLGVWNSKSKIIRKLKASILYSHFVINQNVYGLTINIYYYDGILQYSWYNFVDDINNSKLDRKHWQNPKSIRSYNKKMRPQKLNFYQSRHFFLFLLFYQWFNNKSCSLLTDSLWQIRSNILSSSKNINIVTMNNVNKVGIVLFHTIINKYLSGAKKNSPNSIISKIGGINYETISKIIYMVAYSNIVSKPVLTIIKHYIELLGHIVTKGIYNIDVNLFLIDNDQVTASFLAKYMATRFKQDYTVMDVIRPLTRELKFMKKISLSRVLEVSKVVNPNSLSNLKIDKQRIKFQIKILSNIYNWQTGKFFKNNNILINLDGLITMYAVNNFKNSKKLNSLFLFGNMRMFFCKKLQILLFLKNSNNRYYALFTYYYLKNRVNSNNNFDLFFILREIYDDVFNNFSQISTAMYTKKFNSRLFCIFSYGSLINLSVKCQMKYLQFNFWKFKLTRHAKLLQINKNKLRQPQIEIDGLRGYKIQLKGRFSRKQIASNLTFVEGSVPLNTLKSNIDYAFATIPLRNSAISVKVWLYKQGNTTNYFLKTI